MDEITSVVSDEDLNICISGSNNGCILIHNLLDESYIHRFYYPDNKRVDKIVICPYGYFIVYSKEDMFLRKYDYNGNIKESEKTEVEDIINAICVSPCFNYVITGGQSGYLTIRATLDLKIVKNFYLNGNIKALHVTENEIYVGMNKDIVILQDCTANKSIFYGL